ncbi:lig_chan-Glu_bd domain-containing protein [Trichonephila inaurata madagascariensis]|uniref:Lig_chan-Glu_bd domain-containing protein n=1 Tax=Trichonephila inaurata madagascariensis TaxID=2747483 RepID=A0A8X7CFC3_9ARAC|nr:lig_chan-Glu_bd domain-containing protein [Trichonephila inaurata madagascariensis]GFY67083.1 lig_chan-Glu_bd domain-containing protein [Trichonephila inaurata madagascariensis]
MKPGKKWLISTLNRSRLFEIFPSSDGKPKLHGIEAELIKTLMTKIGVDYEIVTPDDGQYGIELSSGNWTGIIGMLYRGEADIGIANLGMFEDRFRTVDFSFPYLSDGLYFSYIKSANREQLFSFIRMFDFSTWMFFLASFLLASVVILIVLKDQETISSIMLYLFGSFLGQTLMFHKQINEWKVIFLSWMLFAFIMSSVYSGALSSFLVLPSEGKVVETFVDLSEAVLKGSHRAYTLKGTNHAAFLRHYPEQYLQSLGKMIEENDWHITADEMTQDPLEKKYSPDGKPKIDAVIGAKYIFKMLYEVGDFKSKVFVSEDRFLGGSVGIAFKKGFCCISEVNKYITRIVEAGIYDKFLKYESLKYWFSLSSEERNIVEIAEDRILSIRDFTDAFLLLSAGLLISCLVFIIELIFPHLKRQYNKARHRIYWLIFWLKK